MHDVIVIGAGPAGLAAARRLQEAELDTLVIEAAEEIGGRTLSVPVGGLPSNTGAMFVYRGTPAEEYAAEFSVRTAPFRPDTWGVHFGGTTVVDTDTTRVIDALPLSEEARDDLRSFIDRALEEYHTESDPEQATGLAVETMGERLESLHPDARDILARAIQGGSVADPSVLSAQYALRYFASYLAFEKENRLYPLDGMQTIPRELHARLRPGTVRCGVAVVSVDVTGSIPGSAYTVRLADGQQLQARDVVFAVPAPVVQTLAPELPEAKREALGSVMMPGSTTLSVTADVSQAPEIARWSFVATCGVAFDAIINPQPALAGEHPETAQFVCYGNAAGYQPDLTGDDASLQRWVDDFLTVAPELRGRILGAHLQTWEHCFALLTPERRREVGRLQESVGGLHFAGDYTSVSAGTHGAYGEGERAGAAVIARQRAAEGG